MKITGKLLFIFVLYSLLILSANAETIQFGKKRNNKKESDINSAQIKQNEAGVASTSFSNLPKNEIINTFYADPLSDEFMGKDSSVLDSERNRSTKDLLSEFNGQVKEINDNTDIPDEDELVDVHSKDDRARIEARADQLLKEAAIEESKNNTGEALLDKSSNRISEKLSESNNKKDIASFTDLYKENASETTDVGDYIISEGQDNVSKLATDTMEEDPEFSNNSTNSSKEDVIIVEDNSSTDDEIPNYEEMEGIVSEKKENSSLEAVKNNAKNSGEKKKTKLSKKNKIAKKMAEPLDPVLLTEGKPKSSDDESEKIYTYSGLLIPEKQPLGRKKHMLRWVLKLDDGSRIPLKSNLKLMQEVRKENNLDDFVTVSGKMRTSTMEKELRYLVPDSIVKGGKPKASNNTDNKKIESENKNLMKPEQDTASNTDDLKEVTQNPDASDTVQSLQ